MSEPILTACPDARAVAVEAAWRWVVAAEEAVAERGRFVVALSGGSTPQALYGMLRQPEWSARFPWDRTIVTFGDERCVPPDDAQSNFRMAREALLEHEPASQARCLRMPGELDPDAGATAYEAELRELFPAEPWPTLDLLFLGMGGDGHTASLFPDTPALEEDSRWVVANTAPQLSPPRLSLTFPAINAARSVVFLITGSAKAQVTAEVFRGASHSKPHPAERVRPETGTLEVLMDRAAAEGQD